MKRILIIGLIIFLFLGIIGAVVYKLFGTSAPQPSAIGNVVLPQSPTSQGSKEQQPGLFVQAFYSWYIENMATDPQFPHAENRAEVLAPWLTPRFIRDWQNVINETDADPVLIAQDYSPAWGSYMTASETSNNDSESIVHITLGSAENQHSYLVQVVKAPDGTWRINSVTNAK